MSKDSGHITLDGKEIQSLKVKWQDHRWIR
jgi:hypothetical protein